MVVDDLQQMRPTNWLLRKQPHAITVDELHYVKAEILEALVMGLHRAAQLTLPITIAGAGLPSLAALTGEAKLLGRTCAG